MVFVHPSVIFARRDVAWTFVGNVGIEFASKAQIISHTFPILVALLDVAKLGVVDGGLE